VFKQQPFTLVHTTSRQAEKPPDDVDVRVLRNAHQRKFAAAEEKPHQVKIELKCPKKYSLDFLIDFFYFRDFLLIFINFWDF
jgi:hypothetical protein